MQKVPASLEHVQSHVKHQAMYESKNKFMQKFVRSDRKQLEMGNKLFFNNTNHLCYYSVNTKFDQICLYYIDIHLLGKLNNL